MIRYLVDESPLHAWVNNPRLNPNYVPDVSKEKDFGTIIHAILLQGEDVTERIDYPDYRSNKAQEDRDRIRKAGKCPILAKDVPRVEAMIEAAKLQLPLYDDIRGGFVNGKAEVTLKWTDEETGIACKARLDYLHDDHRVIIDYKTTNGSAHPDQVARNVFTNGYDIQGVWYERAVASTFYITQAPEFFLVTQETSEPYALSVVALAPDAKWFGARRCDQGLRLWKECLESGNWPGYMRETAWATLPAWLEKQQLEREMRES
jgi:hypothetical protein